MHKVFSLNNINGSIKDQTGNFTITNQNLKLKNTEKGLSTEITGNNTHYLALNTSSFGLDIHDDATIEAYIKHIKKPDIANGTTLISARGSTGYLDSFQMVWYDNESSAVGRMGISATQANGRGRQIYAPSGTLKRGVWYHVIIKTFGNGDDPVIIIDWVEIAALVMEWGINTWDATYNHFLHNQYNFRLCNDIVQGSSNRNGLGYMSNFTVYKGLPSDGEINKLYSRFLQSRTLAVAKRKFLGSWTDGALEDGDIVFYDKPKYEKADGTNILPRGYVAGTGSYKSENDSNGNQHYECTSSWTIAFQSKQAYGTWEFEIYKGAEANTVDIYLMANSNDIYPNVNGYVFTINANEALRLRRFTGAGVADMATTANSYVSVNTYYKIKITRSVTGDFTVYVNGSLLDTSGGSGTNPVTDTTHTASNYCVFDLDTGDRFKELKLFKGIV